MTLIKGDEKQNTERKNTHSHSRRIVIFCNLSMKIEMLSDSFLAFQYKNWRASKKVFVYAQKYSNTEHTGTDFVPSISGNICDWREVNLSRYITSHTLITNCWRISASACISEYGCFFPFSTTNEMDMCVCIFLHINFCTRTMVALRV